MTKKQWIADGLLLAAAIIWGSAFAVVKNTLDSVPPSMMIALRFGIAALISGVILRKHLRGLTRGQVLMGLLVGVLTGLAYIVQTIGLQDTTVGKNAFLTTIYVLLVPFGSAVLFHEKLGARRYVAAVLMLLGIGILSLDGESGGLNRGDVLTLVCGVLYAAQIISVGRCNERMDTYALIVLEFAFAALTGAGRWRRSGGCRYSGTCSPSAAFCMLRCSQPCWHRPAKISRRSSHRRLMRRC